MLHATGILGLLLLAGAADLPKAELPSGLPTHSVMKGREAPASKVDKAVEAMGVSLRQARLSRVKIVNRIPGSPVRDAFAAHHDSAEYLLELARCREEEQARKDRLTNGAAEIRTELSKEALPAEVAALFSGLARGLASDVSDPKLVNAVVDLLGNEKFRIRELASLALYSATAFSDRGPWVARLTDQESKSSDLEVRSRARAVLLRSGDYGGAPKDFQGCLHAALVNYEGRLVGEIYPDLPVVACEEAGK